MHMRIVFFRRNPISRANWLQPLCRQFVCVCVTIANFEGKRWAFFIYCEPTGDIRTQIDFGCRRVIGLHTCHRPTSIGVFFGGVVAIRRDLIYLDMLSYLSFSPSSMSLTCYCEKQICTIETHDINPMNFIFHSHNRTCRLFGLVFDVRCWRSIALQLDQRRLPSLHFNESHRNQPKGRWHQMVDLLGVVCGLLGVWILHRCIDLDHPILLFA